MTYSVGFRAPADQELATQFLVHLQDRVELDGRYADPELTQPRHPGEIGKDMIEKVARSIGRIAWNRDAVRDFVGCYMTEPKAHVYFDPPDRPLGKTAFAKKISRRGVRLDRRSQLLFSGGRFYLNGEIVDIANGDRELLRELADKRRLPPDTRFSESAQSLIHGWYCDGFVEAGEG